MASGFTTPLQPSIGGKHQQASPLAETRGAGAPSPARSVRTPISGESPASLRTSQGGLPSSGSVSVEVFEVDDRAPAADVTVALVCRQGNETRISKTNAAGRTEFRDVPPGLATLHCVGAGGEREVEVRPGVASECWFEILKTRATVQVQQPDGMPIPGALVRVSRNRRETGLPIGVTDSQGGVEIHPVSGYVLVEASADGFAPSYRFKMPETLQLTIVLEPGGGALMLTVRDRESGRAVNHAVATLGRPPSTVHVVDNCLYPTESPRVGTTDARGTLHLSGIPTGAKPLAVQADGYATWFGHVVIPHGGPEVVLQVDLAKQVTLSGRVVSSEGFVANARVSLLAENQPPQRTYSATDGSFEFLGLSPGTYRLEALEQQTGRCTMEVAVPSADPVEMKLSQAWSVAGIVTDSSGNPLSGARVGVWKLDGMGSGVVFHPQTTSSTGRFHLVLEDSPEAVELAVMYPRGAVFPSVRETVAVGRMDVTLSVDKDREASVYIEADMSGSLWVRSTESGSSVLVGPRQGERELRFGPMPPGEYRVEHLLDLQHITLVGEYLLAPEETLNLGSLD